MSLEEKTPIDGPNNIENPLFPENQKSPQTIQKK